MNDITELLPLARGDVDILRGALAKMRAALRRRNDAAEALLNRLADGTISSAELDVLRQLVEKECTVRSLIISQHAPDPDPYAGEPPLEVLEALKAKLGRASPSD